MSDPILEVFDAEELARLMGSSVQAIRNAVHRGQEGVTIPRSVLLGTRRRWLRSTVYAWLRQKAKAPKTGSVQAQPHHPRKEDQMSRLKLRVGDSFADRDGVQFTVQEISARQDRVVFEDDDGEEVVASLEETLEDIESGDLARLNPAGAD